MLLSFSPSGEKVLSSLAYLAKSAPESDPCGDKCSGVYIYTRVISMLGKIFFFHLEFLLLKPGVTAIFVNYNFFNGIYSFTQLDI